MRFRRFFQLALGLALGAAAPLLFTSLRAADANTATLASDPALAEAIGKARAIIQHSIAPKAPGVSVAVGIDGKIVWSEGFGYADRERKIPVTATSRFRVGSIAKSLTAAGLALLVERGQLDLDKPVRDYVPDLPAAYAPITTRMLGGHLSGIRHYKGREMYLNKPYATVRAGLKIFENDPLESTPGTTYLYSTYGWSVISAVMEVAAKQDFLSYMDANVLQPLHLDQTRPDRAGAVDPQRTQFYENNAAGEVVIAPPVDNSYKWAAGGYLSTPEDLVRFGTAHLAPGFLKKETLNLLFTPQKTADGKPTTYGIGWVVTKDAQGHPTMSHTGGSIGGTSILIIHPTSKTVVAMVCNHRTSPFTKPLSESIVEIFAPLFDRQR